MNILILGGGGREHALAWAVAQNPKCDRLLVAPGNAGIATEAETVPLDIADPSAVVALARDRGIDFVIVGPEAPLVAGVVDALEAAGILAFGPTAAAARLEASKAFTKEICAAAGVPTAAWARFDEAAAAEAHVATAALPLVIKADGLAAGKGVVIAETRQAARNAVADMFAGAFGAAGARVVIEEFMPGAEASFFVLCDGETALPVGTAQDHKRAFDGDRGPNTGGMGAFSPSPLMTPALQAQVMAEIVRPTLAEMARRGTPYRGVLYAGLMLHAGRARLVEYNARFGDPEAQVLMMRLGAQALDLMLACAEGRLADMAVHWADDHALTVVMASEGYPGPPRTGTEIRGLDRLPADGWQQVFHAGTRAEEGRLLAAGGRVLNVTARGRTLAEARSRAYDLVDRIDWPEGFCRRDIGARAAAG